MYVCVTFYILRFLLVPYTFTLLRQYNNTPVHTNTPSEPFHMVGWGVVILGE